MNNKTATNLSATGNSAESTAASSTITTSDPDSSVSTLSPATTPSMDFGQVDSMEYGAPMYYPGYYDENGMLVIRKFLDLSFPFEPPNDDLPSFSHVQRIQLLPTQRVVRYITCIPDALSLSIRSILHDTR